MTYALEKKSEMQKTIQMLEANEIKVLRKKLAKQK